MIASSISSKILDHLHTHQLNLTLKDMKRMYAYMQEALE